MGAATISSLFCICLIILVIVMYFLFVKDSSGVITEWVTTVTGSTSEGTSGSTSGTTGTTAGSTSHSYVTFDFSLDDSVYRAVVEDTLASSPVLLFVYPHNKNIPPPISSDAEWDGGTVLLNRYGLSAPFFTNYAPQKTSSADFIDASSKLSFITAGSTS